MKKRYILYCVIIYRAKGMTSSQIARRLGVTPEHVRAYYFNKLNNMRVDEIIKLLFPY